METPQAFSIEMRLPGWNHGHTVYVSCDEALSRGVFRRMAESGDRPPGVEYTLTRWIDGARQQSPAMFSPAVGTAA